MVFGSIFSKQKSYPTYHFGLLLKEENAIGAIIEEREDGMSILAKKHISYTNGWENILEDVDRLISSLQDKTDVIVDVIVYFVYAYCVDDTKQQIRKPYVDIMRTLSKELEFKKPQYLTCYEGIATWLTKREEKPIDFILVEMDENQVTVLAYKSGRREYIHTIARSDDCLDDLKIELHVLAGIMSLPLRMYVYSSNDLDDLCASIVDHDWGDLFEHKPTTIYIPETELIDGLVHTYGDQIPGKAPVATTSKKHRNVNSAIDVEGRDILSSKTVDEEVEELYEDEGIEGEDLSNPDENNHHPIREDGKKLKSLGFVVGRDIATTPQTNYPLRLFGRAVDPSRENPFSHKSKASFVDSHRNNSVGRSYAQRLQERGRWKRWIPMGGGVGAFLVIGIIGIEIFFHSATVYIYAETQEIEKEISFMVSIDALSEEGNLGIKEHVLSVETSASRGTTGNREDGDRASGVVTLHNFSDEVVAFDAGTLLRVDSKTYLLDQDVTIPAATEEIVNATPAKFPGKEQGTITAVDIGPQYNIEAGQRFRIGDTSRNTFFALNDDAIAGGSQRSLQTVSEDDLTMLRTALEEKAKARLQEDFRQTQGGEEEIIDPLVSTKVDSIDIPYEIGEESSEIEGSATVQMVYYTHNPDDTIKAIAETLSKDVDEGYDLPAQSIVFTIDDAIVDNNNIDIDITARGKAQKTIDVSTVYENIVGRPVPEVEYYIAKELDVREYDIMNNSIFFFTQGRMPWWKNNIVLTVDNS